MAMPWFPLSAFSPQKHLSYHIARMHVAMINKPNSNEPLRHSLEVYMVPNDPNEYKNSHIKPVDLDQYIGNNNGFIDITGNTKGFTASASDVKLNVVRTEGAENIYGHILSMTLKDKYDFNNPRTLNLALFLNFTPKDGEISWNWWSPNPMKSGTAFKMDSDWNFSCLLMANDGNLVESQTVNLKYLFPDHPVWTSNLNSSVPDNDFKPSWDREKGRVLAWEYEHPLNGSHQECSLLIEDYFDNKDGMLVVNKKSAFSYGGTFWKFLEGVPVIGFGVLAVYLLNGDTNNAKRAFAKSAYATIVLLSGTVGIAFGGPLGYALAHAIGTGLAEGVEKAIADGTGYVDHDGDFSPISLERWIAESCGNAITGPGLTATKSHLREYLKNEFIQPHLMGYKDVLKDAGTRMISTSTYLNGEAISSATQSSISSAVDNWMIEKGQKFLESFHNATDDDKAHPLTQLRDWANSE